MHFHYTFYYTLWYPEIGVIKLYLHHHYDDRGYLQMLFSCFRVLLKVIATNQGNLKMVLPKQSVQICMSYDPNKKVMCEKFFLKEFVNVIFVLCGLTKSHSHQSGEFKNGLT